MRRRAVRGGPGERHARPDGQPPSIDQAGRPRADQALARRRPAQMSLRRAVCRHRRCRERPAPRRARAGQNVRRPVVNCANGSIPNRHHQVRTPPRGQSILSPWTSLITSRHHRAACRDAFQSSLHHSTCLLDLCRGLRPKGMSRPVEAAPQGGVTPGPLSAALGGADWRLILAPAVHVRASPEEAALQRSLC